MTADRPRGARAKATTKGRPQRTGTPSSPKRFLMPAVDLEGLGGDDVGGELPPLDLTPFIPKATSSAPSVPDGDTRVEAPADSGTPVLRRSTELNVEPAGTAPGTPDTGGRPGDRTPAGGVPRTHVPGPVLVSTSPALWNDTGSPHEPAPWGSAASGSAVPVRRPRRPVAQASTHHETRSRREQRLKELLAKAPSYALLLESYTTAQSGKEIYQKRNIQLYGLTAQELADRITVDKAVMTAMNLPAPRFTPAHYLDAVLERALGPLDPQGADLRALETDRDIVWELARDGLAYRDYISVDPAVTALKKPRSQCPLRIRVNQRVSRMMDILKTMPDLKAQPFEIISACLAKYLQALQGEQLAFEELWSRSLETSYE